MADLTQVTALDREQIKCVTLNEDSIIEGRLDRT